MDQGNIIAKPYYYVSEIKSESDLINIRECWARLYCGKNPYSHYQSFEWLQHYMRDIIGKNKNTCIFLLYRNEEPIAIAPLIGNRNFLFWEYRFITEKTQADYLDFIYDDLEPYELEILLKTILRKNCLSSIILKKVPEASKTLKLLIAANKMKILHLAKEKCVQIKLNDSFNEYSDRLGKSTKKETKSVENKIKKEFSKAEVEIIVETPILPDLMDELMGIYLKRRIVKFKKETRGEEYYKFLKYYISKNKNIFISILRLNSKIVAFNIGFFSRNERLEILITSFDSDYGKYQVGNYLLYHSIRKIIESGLAGKKGVHYYDLGLGDELYKIKYGGEYHNINEYYLCDNFFLFKAKLFELRVKKVIDKYFGSMIQFLKKSFKKVEYSINTQKGKIGLRELKLKGGMSE